MKVSRKSSFLMGQAEDFDVYAIIDSMAHSGASFEQCLTALEKVEGKLKPEMKTIQLGNMLYEALVALNEDAATVYRKEYVTIPVRMEKGGARYLRPSTIRDMLIEELSGYRLASKVRDRLVTLTYEAFRTKNEVFEKDLRHFLRRQLYASYDSPPTTCPVPPYSFYSETVSCLTRYAQDDGTIRRFVRYLL
jgi:hypothetical protein